MTVPMKNQCSYWLSKGTENPGNGLQHMLIGSDRDKGSCSLRFEGRMVPEQLRQLGKRTLFHEPGGTTDQLWAPGSNVTRMN